MNRFHYNIIIVALVIFSLFMVYVLLLLYSNKKNNPYPPFMSQCPDYWIYDSSSKTCTPNKESKNVGTLKTTDKIVSLGNIVVNASLSTVRCAKKLWANVNGIEWSGVSNYNGC